MNSPYILNFPKTLSPISVQHFVLNEALNSFSELTLVVNSITELNLSQYVGQFANFSWYATSADAIAAQTIEALSGSQPYPLPLRIWHGVVYSIELLSASADQFDYRFTLSSRFTVLKQHTTSRLFQNQTVPDIIAALLRKHEYSGNDFRFTLSRTYPIREYCTQYQESDWDFILRLCSEEGIFCYFEQSEDKDIWHFADSTSAYQRSEYTVPYRENAGLESVGREVLSEFRMMQQAADTKIRIDDYNYRTATTSLVAEYTPTRQTAVDGSFIQWGLHHKTPDEAQQQLQLLREVAECQRIRAQGQSNVVAFTPNLVFKTQPSFNESGWLIISAEHSGSRDNAYTNTFTAIPAHLPYRPKRLPHPQVAGSLNAHVVSPDNYTYAYIDDMGRYRVRLPFDLDEWSPGGDSRPVRLAKPYAGPSYGQHFPLHEGTEVMLSFIQGNPDRPYISGVVHDSKNQEHVNNEWNTRNVIRTWANNKLRMEDKQGQEHIKLATEYGKTQLNLGHLVDSQRQPRGKGFELRTDEWGAIRAGKGLFLSADKQESAAGEQLDISEALMQLRTAVLEVENLNQAIASARAELADIENQKIQLQTVYQELKEQAILLSAPAGIAAVSPNSIQLSSGNNLLQVSSNNTDIQAMNNFTASAKEKISLYSYKQGIQIYSSKQNIDIQAHGGELQNMSKGQMTLVSTENKIVLAGKEEILLTSGEAYIRIKNGTIEMGAPNPIWHRSGGLKETGVNTMSYPYPELPGAICKECLQKALQSGSPLAGRE